jgi:hypothetical protein
MPALLAYLSGAGKNFVKEDGKALANQEEVKEHFKKLCGNVEFASAPSNDCQYIVHPDTEAPSKKCASCTGSPIKFSEFEKELKNHSNCKTAKPAQTNGGRPSTRKSKSKGKLSVASEAENQVGAIEAELKEAKVKLAQAEKDAKSRGQNLYYAWDVRKASDRVEELTEQLASVMDQEEEPAMEELQDQAETSTSTEEPRKGRGRPRRKKASKKGGRRYAATESDTKPKPKTATPGVRKSNRIQVKAQNEAESEPNLAVLSIAESESAPKKVGRKKKRTTKGKKTTKSKSKKKSKKSKSKKSKSKKSKSRK